MAGRSTACLTELELLDLAEGQAGSHPHESVQHHLRSCSDCRAALGLLLTWDNPEARGWRLPKAGDVVGRYRVVAHVGSGGTGMVLSAEDPLLKRQVALKLLHQRAFPDGPAAARLAHEAQALAKLSHPHIVSIYDVGEWQHQLFIAMEWVEGGDLSGWLQREKRSAKEIVAVFRQAGDGLMAAHRAGLVHRDFKPQNVLVGRDERARVADFGFVIQSTDAKPSIAGTLAYMAPEQRATGQCDARSDQFSFCVALKEALRDSGALPRRLRSALERGTREEPEARFPDMESLLAKLNPRGPRAARLLFGSIAGGLALLGAVHVLEERQKRACLTDDSEMASAWNGKAQEKMRTAFLLSGLPYAEDTWLRTRRQLDAFVQQWAAVRAENCLALHFRHDETAQINTLRGQCLDERKGDFRTLTRLLSGGGPDLVRHAIQAVQSLEPAGACSQTSAVFGGGFLRPELPGEHEARAALEQTRALKGAFQFREALDSARQAVDAARQADTPRLLAEALVLQGSVEAQLRLSSSTATLQQAVWLAQANRLDHWSLEAALRLAEQTYFDNAPLAQVWTGYADSISKRMPDELREDFTLELQEARMARMQSNLAEAETHLKRAEGLSHSDKDRLALESLNAAVYQHFGRSAQSQLAREKALAIATGLYGPLHLETAEAMLELAEEYPHAPEKKSALLRRALPLLEESLGGYHRSVGIAYDRLAQAETYAGVFSEALPHAKRALEILGQGSHEDAAYAFAAGNLGDVYAGLGDRPRALALYRLELERRTALFGEDYHLFHPLMRIAELRLSENRPEAALPLIRKAARLWARGPRRTDPTSQARLDFATARTSNNEALLQKAEEEARRSEDPQLMHRIEAWRSRNSPAT